MYLMYHIDDTGNRVYTLQKVGPKGIPTESAHPARFSPEDTYSKPRIIIKTRFGLLKTQSVEPAY